MARTCVAIEATARWTRSNSNLGIVLLVAPLARAALCAAETGEGTLRAALRGVLAETNVDDARDVYAAIRLAAPGGLGHAPKEDVKNDPTVTLVEAMRLAADRDGIAREYADSFEATFEIGAPALGRARAGLEAAEDLAELALVGLLGAEGEAADRVLVDPARARRVVGRPERL